MIHLDKWLAHTNNYNHYQKMSINPNSIISVGIREISDNNVISIRIGMINDNILILFKNDGEGCEYGKSLYNYIISTLDKGFYLDIKESDLIGKN